MNTNYDEARRDNFIRQLFKRLTASAHHALATTQHELAASAEDLAQQGCIAALQHIDKALGQHSLFEEADLLRLEQSAVRVAAQAVQNDFVDLCRKAQTQEKHRHAIVYSMYSEIPSSPESLLSVADLCKVVLDLSAGSPKYTALAKAAINSLGETRASDLAQEAGVKPHVVSDWRDMLRHKLRTQITPRAEKEEEEET